MAIEPQEIGRRIKEARERKGWTQLQFALEAHVSPGTISRWERGQLPPVRELGRIADLLGVPVEEFVEDEPDEDRVREIVHDELAPVLASLSRLERRLKGET